MPERTFHRPWARPVQQILPHIIITQNTLSPLSGWLSEDGNCRLDCEKLVIFNFFQAIINFRDS